MAGNILSIAWSDHSARSDLAKASPKNTSEARAKEVQNRPGLRMVLPLLGLTLP
jgi:hypothetical protein